MDKKYLIIAGIIIAILAIGGGAFAYVKSKSKPATNETAPQQKKRSSQPLNVIPVAERPYIKIVPKDVFHVDLIVQGLKKPATEVEYELEYQTESQLQGLFDTIKLDSIPAVKDIFFGSCSAGGKCTQHKGVTGGTLLTRFQGAEAYALQSDWRFIENKLKESEMGSKDAKFQLVSNELKTHSLVVIFNTAGFPEGLTGTPISDPYSLTSTQPFKGTAELTMRANEEGATAIMGWNGSTWKEFAAKVDGKTVTTTADLMELYIVVKK